MLLYVQIECLYKINKSTNNFLLGDETAGHQEHANSEEGNLKIDQRMGSEKSGTQYGLFELFNIRNGLN